ncbi:MAG: hypothetical protein IJ485_01670 [Lachnospiraceae bacterium]|nr:hypothetical protein [Lachnospiraceae bacterium]
MPDTEQMDAIIKEEKKRIKNERKQLKQDQKAQKKEVRRRAKELAAQEYELDDSEDDDKGSGSALFVTLLVVVIWIAILCLLVKLDVGGFGSNVLRPVLKDVPVVNKILPTQRHAINTTEEYYGYSSLEEAVEQIKRLELELEKSQQDQQSEIEEIEVLKAEVKRLQTFEESQVEFQRIRTQFYEEVVYADNGPGAEEYQKYYETMDPEMAQYLYKQVVQQEIVNKEIEDYALAYSEMKPKEAAGIIEAMPDELDLAARILKTMSAEDRGKILGVMDPEVAAKLTKIMDPEY